MYGSKLRYQAGGNLAHSFNFHQISTKFFKPSISMVSRGIPMPSTDVNQGAEIKPKARGGGSCWILFMRDKKLFQTSKSADVLSGGSGAGTLASWAHCFIFFQKILGRRLWMEAINVISICIQSLAGVYLHGFSPFCWWNMVKASNFLWRLNGHLVAPIGLGITTETGGAGSGIWRRIHWRLMELGICFDYLFIYLFIYCNLFRQPQTALAQA